MEIDAIILPLTQKLSLEEFLELLSIKPSGLAEKLIAPVYHQIFTHSRELKNEYKKYYSVEYATLGEYIEICHNKELSEYELDKPYIFKIENLFGVADPIYDVDYLDRILNILVKMEKTNES